MATFQAGGLASGLDTNAIVDQLVALEGRGLTTLQNRQRGLQQQVSVLGDLMSKLSALKSAAKSLADAGTVGIKSSSTHSAFSANPTSGATAGRYNVQVTSLAQAAKARSQSFNAESALVMGTELKLSMKGTDYNISVADGSTLADVAYAINESGAPVSAVVLNSGNNYYLSVTTKDTGYPVGESDSSALSITETPTGMQGQALNLGITQKASNSKIYVDGLEFERQTNQISDVIPNVTLSLSATMASAEDLVLSNDASATKDNLQKFVDAYNSVATVLYKQLNVNSDTNRSTTLAGDSTLRSLQTRLQQLGTTSIAGLSNIRTLADVGIKTARDGSISLDSTVLEKALSRDPSAINMLFSKDQSGLGDVAGTLVDNYVNTVDGLLSDRKSSITKRISSLDDEAANYQMRLDSFRKTLIERFTSMEKLVSGFKSVGTFLSQQDAKASKG